MQTDDLISLRRESLRLILVCASFILYIWGLILFQPINLYVDNQLGPVGWGPVLLAGGLLIAFVTQKYNLSVAAGTAILGIAATILFNMWLLDVRMSPYMLAVVVSLTGVLFGIRTVIGSAILSSLAILFIGTHRWGYDLRAPELFTPILTICAVGILSSLGVRNLYTALHWAMDRAMAAQYNEKEARAHRGELARTLKALTEAYQHLEYANYDLARAREVAEAASLNKQRFVAIVSHEMRTPLNVLTALSEIMYFSPERYSDAPLPPELRRDIREIYRSSQHLLHLIEDVLDLAQIEAGQMRVEFQPTRLENVVTEILDMVGPFVREKGLALRAELPGDLPLVLIDHDRVRQVLLNLLNNAQRFTEHGTLTVSAELLEKQVKVTVADTGIGIPRDEHEEMFKEFYQVEGLVAKGQGGCGLGLAICRRFIEMHGGRIWVESEGIPGYGSHFHFTLPVAGIKQVKTSRLQPSTPISLHAPTSRGRILLLLDQDPGIPSLLERNLEEYQVVRFENVAEAPRLAEELHAQAILVNSVYQGQAAPHIKALRQGLDDAALPLSIIACPLVGKRQLGQALGARDYLVKPITREMLLAVIDRLATPVQQILVVDDEPQMGRLIARMLETSRRDYEVFYVTNGREGLHTMRTQRPDLLLLDLMMPEMDGQTVLREIRADATLRDIPVVVITAQAITPEEERSLSRQTLLVHAETRFTNGEVLAYLRGILKAGTES